MNFNAIFVLLYLNTTFSNSDVDIKCTDKSEKVGEKNERRRDDSNVINGFHAFIKILFQRKKFLYQNSGAQKFNKVERRSMLLNLPIRNSFFSRSL